MAASTAVHFFCATRRDLRRAHSSPPMTSSARVMAKKVRSRVRPAYLAVLTLPSGEWSSGTVSVKPAVCLDWSSCRLSQPAIKEANHLESLGSAGIGAAMLALLA